MALIAILVIVCTPSHRTKERKERARQIVCAYNLKGIDDGFNAWKDEHNGLLPMQVSVTNGGTMELTANSVITHFLILTNSKLRTIQSRVISYDDHGTNRNQLYSETNYGISL